MAVSSLNPYAPSGSNDDPMNLLAKNKKKKADYTEDVVTVSQEARELTEELRYKKNLTHVVTEQDISFDKVVKSLPSTTGFHGMLDWLSTSKRSATLSFSKNDEVDRNVYMKDPKKYAAMWEKMYDQFDKTLSSLGLTQESAQYKEIIGDERVNTNLMYKFTSSLDAETRDMLGFFNIRI